MPSQDDLLDVADNRSTLSWRRADSGSSLNRYTRAPSEIGPTPSETGTTISMKGPIGKDQVAKQKERIARNDGTQATTGFALRMATLNTRNLDHATAPGSSRLSRAPSFNAGRAVITGAPARSNSASASDSDTGSDDDGAESVYSRRSASFGGGLGPAYAPLTVEEQQAMVWTREAHRRETQMRAKDIDRAHTRENLLNLIKEAEKEYQRLLSQLSNRERQGARMRRVQRRLAQQRAKRLEEDDAVRKLKSDAIEAEARTAVTKKPFTKPVIPGSASVPKPLDTEAGAAPFSGDGAAPTGPPRPTKSYIKTGGEPSPAALPPK